MINDCGYAIVGGNLQKNRVKLLTLADIDRFNVVAKSRLFEEHRDFMTVRCGPVVKVNHVSRSGFFESLVGGEHGLARVIIQGGLEFVFGLQLQRSFGGWTLTDLV